MAQVEFRDGTREVPDHVADMMIGLDTYKMTYEQAKSESDKKFARDILTKAQQQIIDSALKAR